MIISRVEEDRRTMGEKQAVSNEDDDQDHLHDYQTANELFELMAKNSNFKPTEDESLTTRDLVLLYKNIDLGTKLMSNANEFKRKTPNQYVETVVYNEDAESDSDISEIYSSEDLHNVVLINKERIDLLNNPPSLENTLCQKLGDLEMKTSTLNTEYNRKFLFKDPYIKEQLQSLNLKSNGFEGTVLPASLLDYICCKRLEDNYNFYMDNIIRYVKHTIEQLKRISNGDYLTDKAKEKWRFVENDTKHVEHDDNTTVLESSTSIPLHVERKISGHVTTWDDIVHSEVDVRSLSKILEKKIVFEIPKLICDSYRIFSKCCADNLVVSCKKEVKSVTESKKEESRVDVVFQLTRSESGHVMSNISSIMILQNTSEQREISPSDVLPITYNEANKAITSEAEHQVKIVEIDDHDNNNNLEFEIEVKNETTISPEEHGFDSDIDTTGFESSSINAGYQDSSESSKDKTYKKRNDRAEASFDLIPSDELRLTMQRLNLQTTLPEESLEEASVKTTNKKKSPTRIRIKSPYENKSFIMEEKKRKRLLEIRQRREKSKIAMTENCKVSKHKNSKGIIIPQPSTSVTKLSITNKSFYNSIYGQAGTVNGDPKQSKQKCRKDKKDASLDMSSEPEGEEVESIKTPAIRSQKFINRSYYLDDTVTEIMYMQMKKKNGAKDLLSESTSIVSTDFNTNLKILSQLIAPSVSEVDVADSSIYTPEKFQGLDDILQNIDPNKCMNKNLVSSQSTDNLVAMNTPKGIQVHCDKDDSKKSNTSIEFRKSIDRLYDLMKKMGKAEGNETKPSKSKFTVASTEYFKVNEDRPSSTVQCSDSGTSIKHHLTSSNPSCFSFDKAPNVKTVNINTESEKQSTVVPKVIISTKSQTLKTDAVKVKRERKKSAGSPNAKVVRSNPLKAISQLLHEFDSVQKSRLKTPSAPKIPKKQDNDGRTSSRQVSYRGNSRLEPHIKDKEPYTEKHAKLHPVKEKRPKLMHPNEFSRLHQTQIISAEDKYAHRTARKQAADIMDEVKESRGEAVRGPPRLNSRLHSLAQPKRTYVQAHVEEFQTRYGRSQLTDRLQRMAAAMVSPNVENVPGSPNSKHNKNRRNGGDIGSTMPVKQPQPSVTPSERLIRLRPLSSSSAEAMMQPLVADMSYKQSSNTEAPDNMKKKMVAVESYVKNHFGRRSPMKVPSEVLRDGHKSRTPLLPNDLELASLTSSPTIEESNAIGSRLHYIIDTMMIPSPPPLTVLAECNESNSKQSKDEIDETSLADNFSKEDISLMSDEASDYHDDEFQDHHVSTSGVENKNDDKDYKNVVSNDFQNTKLRDDVQLALQSFNCSNELEKIESALYRRISVGTFQKRLRIKNLTLTPKQSTQQVLLLQSGDAGSIVLKSTISQETKASKSKSEARSDIKNLPGLSNSLNWDIANFPIQIATVGYSFPEPQSFPCSKTKIRSLIETDGNANKDKLLTKTANRRAASKSANSNKTNQCLKSLLSDPHLGQAGQDLDFLIDLSESITTSKIIDINHSSITDLQNCGILYGPKKNFQTLESSVEIQDSKIVEEPFDEKIEISNDMKNDVANDEKPNAVKKAISVDYTTSLDILAGLLNEIQKITTCQTQIMNTDSDYYNDERTKDLEIILNEAAALDNKTQNNARQVISISSLDKLRQLESNPSIFSLYVSNDGDKDMYEGQNNTSEVTSLDVKDNVISEVATIDATVETETSDNTVEDVKVSCSKPAFADKGIAVEFPLREFVNNFTDTPSRLNPVTVNNCTTISNSMIGVFSQPSSQSMFSFTENDTLYCNIPLVSQKKIIELEKDIVNIKETSGTHSQCLVASQTVTVLKDKKELHSNNNEIRIENKILNDTINKSINRQFTQISYIQKQAVDKQYYDVISECDPVMKMKRDILVTVYSILVFTVFAALSFPEIMYHV